MTVADDLISTALADSKNIMEVGIGTGYSTFLIFGGKMKPEYDFYFNISTDHKKFWKGEDIYNSVDRFDISQFIEKRAEKRIYVATDFKESLIKQAEQLGFIDKTIVEDANEKISVPDNVDAIYSNILYWLKDPFAVLKKMEENISRGTKVVVVFPNSNFLKYCRSYGKENEFWKLLNRNRVDSLMWTLDVSEFEQRLTKETNLKIKKFQTYLNKETLSIWDTGLRPFSPHLIKMANSLDFLKRLEIKHEWVETSYMFAKEILDLEVETGSVDGGFNFFILEKQ
jgi:trans-aconitate methyltransferase